MDRKEYVDDVDRPDNNAFIGYAGAAAATLSLVFDAHVCGAQRVAV